MLRYALDHTANILGLLSARHFAVNLILFAQCFKILFRQSFFGQFRSGLVGKAELIGKVHCNFSCCVANHFCLFLFSLN